MLPQSTLVAVFLLSVSSTALAQTAPVTTSTTPPPDFGVPPVQPTVEDARRLFDQGVAELHDERYADAVNSFRASQQIRESASCSLNLGISLRALGRVVEARRELMTFLRIASPSLRQQNEVTVNNYLADLQQRMAVVTLTDRNPSTMVVTVDRQASAMSAAGEIELDPGAHTIVAESLGYTTFRQSITLPVGARISLRVALEPSAPTQNDGTNSANRAANSAADPRVSLGPSAPPPPVTSRWWFWTVVGVGAAAVVGTTIAIVATSGYVDPAGSTTGRVIQGLSN